MTGCIGESIVSFFLWHTFAARSRIPPAMFVIRPREDNTVYDFNFMCNIRRYRVYVCVKASRHPTRECYARSSRAFNNWLLEQPRPHMVLRVRVSNVNQNTFSHGRITYHVTINR